jgi:anthranilate synthase component 1
MLNSEKEKAEHIMLVDLARNDLGRVSEPQSVKVTSLMGVEKYPHVMHMVSNVVSKLKSGMDAIDLFKASFPAGTVSGAPKVRAMEIIEELENRKRGPYAGAVGYFSFSGEMDTCITIRTILLSKGKAYIQAGAGIVADSDPYLEYQESLNKAKGMLKALEQTP